jgi:DNA-binding NtrC family response regulator
LTESETAVQRHKAVEGRILVVDDDQFFCKVLSILLSRQAFEVRCAPGVDSAMELLTKQSFDAIVTDLRMPGASDGLTLLEKVRSTNKAVPVIILTGYGEVDNYLRAMNLGATEYLNKPVRSEDLLAIIRSYMNLHRHGPESRP